MGCMIYFQFCTLGLQQKIILQQHVVGMYKACCGLHQPDSEVTLVTGSVELGGAVEFAELGAGMAGADVVGLSSITIRGLSPSGLPYKPPGNWSQSNLGLRS